VRFCWYRRLRLGLREREGLQRRRVGSWIVFTVATFGVAASPCPLARPFRCARFSLPLSYSPLFPFPGVRHWGLRVRLAPWNLAGLLTALGYIGAATYAHHVALQRVDKFFVFLAPPRAIARCASFPAIAMALGRPGPHAARSLRTAHDLGAESTEVQADSTGP